MAAQLFKNENMNDHAAKTEVLNQIEGKTKKECEKVLMQIAPPPKLPKENTKRVDQNFHSVKLNLSDSTLKLLNELKNRMAHRRLTQDELLKEIFEQALNLYMVKKTNAKFTTPAVVPCETRYIPKYLQAYVFKRDNGHCSKCGSERNIQFDHIKPFALGGKTTRDNLRLLCFSCNQRQRIKAKL